MYYCEDCGRETKIMHGATMGRILCQSCYHYYKQGNRVYPLPKFAEIEYSKDNKPICHICGKAYNKLMSHAWQVHGLTEKEYKTKFGLDKYKSILSPSTKRRHRECIYPHYQQVVVNNLIVKGEETRYTKGNKGRTIDKVSPQTLRRLKQTSFIKKGVN